MPKHRTIPATHHMDRYKTLGRNHGRNRMPYNRYRRLTRISIHRMNVALIDLVKCTLIRMMRFVIDLRCQWLQVCDNYGAVENTVKTDTFLFGKTGTNF